MAAQNTGLDTIPEVSRQLDVLGMRLLAKMSRSIPTAWRGSRIRSDSYVYDEGTWHFVVMTNHIYRHPNSSRHRSPKGAAARLSFNAEQATPTAGSRPCPNSAATRYCQTALGDCRCDASTSAFRTPGFHRYLSGKAGWSA